ncbi:hypothetical protein [Streptomyces sp. NBC_01237]|uniref:hypothetical protein n=1 Tax=Streptomyces sp. NBC_01237 TaxID=2903790 RepID=UPI002DD99BAA|nr:hypothetical protein [Streptomyces sp. NBC_01237]WRZ78489.1 hypothetical protein OG251_43445 [Streptomyces sp. NBC_01237]
MPPRSPVRVDEGALSDRLGPDATRFDLTGVSLIVGATEIQIIADANADPASSGVRSRDQFRLVGEVPADIDEALTGYRDIWSFGELRQRPVSIAIRVGIGCLLLGRAEFRHWRPGRYEFEFVEPLTSSMLEMVRPSVPDPVLPTPTWVDLVAARPQEALTLFVESWFARSRQPSINTSAEAVPAALAAFYRLAEERPGILGSHNYVHEPEPDRCGRGEEHLSFACEVQGCWSWCCPRRPDTENGEHTVLLVRDDEALPEQEPLSRFLLQFVLHEATFSAPYLAQAVASADDIVPLLRSVLREVPLRPFMAPLDPTTFLAGPGIVVALSDGPGENGEVAVSIGALHRSALRPLGQFDVPWIRFDG